MPERLLPRKEMYVNSQVTEREELSPIDLGLRKTWKLYVKPPYALMRCKQKLLTHCQYNKTKTHFL